MIPTPKERFLSDTTAAKKHADTVASSAFIQALDMAMLEYSSQCASTTNPAEGGLLLRGAKGFARTLCELSEPQTKPKTIDRGNLE